MAYAGESNIPSRYVVKDDGKDENGDTGNDDERLGDPALAEIDDSAPAPIVAIDSAAAALVEVGTSP